MFGTSTFGSMPFCSLGAPVLPVLPVVATPDPDRSKPARSGPDPDRPTPTRAGPDPNRSTPTGVS